MMYMVELLLTSRLFKFILHWKDNNRITLQWTESEALSTMMPLVRLYCSCIRTALQYK